MSGVWSGGVRSTIANVTTTHVLLKKTRYGVVPLLLDLKKIADSNREIFGWSYNPPKFMPAVKLNVECHPYFSKINVALYASGSVVQTGCQSPEQARLAAHIFARTTMKILGLDVVVSNFNVDNMAVKVDVNAGDIDLAVLDRFLGARCSYKDPKYTTAGEKSYPAAVLTSKFDRKTASRPKGENIKFLMYDTTRAVMMGVKSRESVVLVTEEIVEIVRRVREIERAVIVRESGTLGVTKRTPGRVQMDKIKSANAAIRRRTVFWVNCTTNK